jgi:hypothetical protein
LAMDISCNNMGIFVLKPTGCFEAGILDHSGSDDGVENLMCEEFWSGSDNVGKGMRARIRTYCM